MATVTRFNPARAQKTKDQTQPIKEKLWISGGMDFTLLVTVLILLGFGLVMIYSASTYTGITKFGDATYYFKKQLGIALMSLAIMLGVSFINYKVLAKLILPMNVVSILLLIAVQIFGEEFNGAKRWLSLGPLNFQPSELTKAVVLITSAFICALVSKKMKKNKEIAFTFALITIPSVGLILIQNLSTAVIVASIAVGIFLVAYRKIGWFVFIVMIGVVGIVLFLMFGDPFRMARIRIWRDPYSDPRGLGYQTIQSLYAIGSGGLFGKGLGQSIQKLGFIPEAHNDIIFSIICEELGLFGATLIMLIFLVFLWRCMMIANSSTDLFGTLLAAGLLIQVGVQVLLNIAVVTNTIPNTGVPLPFISYGGSSLFILMAEVGVVLNVARQRKFAYS